MCDLGTYILNIVMIITTVWVVKRFWSDFFEKKVKSFLSITAWVIFCIFQLISQTNSGNMNIGMPIINALLILLIAISGYSCVGKEKYFLLVVFCTVWSLVEIFTFFLLSSAPIHQNSLNMIGMVISKLIMVILVYIVSVIWGKRNRELISNNLHLYLLFVPIGSIYIAVNQFYSKITNIYSTITISILLLFNVVIFEIYMKMNEMFLYEKEKTVYAQQLDIITGNTVEQKKIMEEFHEEKHNLINELIVIKVEIEHNDKENVLKNLNKIINKCHNEETVSNSGNCTVDAIINFKYTVAREYGIEFQLKLFLPDELPIEQCDIGIILGNAIDNAIEAVKECKNKEKVIKISMGIKKEACIIIIKNPYEHHIKKNKTGRILSTKKEEYRHGYGLKSIKKIAEEYEGEAITDVNNGMFTLTVVLNMKDL